MVALVMCKGRGSHHGCVVASRNKVMLNPNCDEREVEVGGVLVDRDCVVGRGMGFRWIMDAQ